jgi:hypothetical protein
LAGAVTGQHSGKGQIGLTQLNETDESDKRIGDDLVDRVFAALGVKMSKSTLSVLSDDWEHLQELLVPLGNRRLLPNRF